jgi:DNA-directed RNA polymerase subunit B
MKKLVDSFYRDRSIVNHQIASYNDFLERRLQNIVDSTIIGQEEEMKRGYIYPEIEGYKIKFGKIKIGKPEVKEADGTIRWLTPMEARLRDLTYEASLTLEFIPVKDDVEYDPEEVRIGELPIMIKSKACNLAKHAIGEKKGHELSNEEYKKELQGLQEDPLDPGAYFISNGTERVLITVEDLAPNRVLVEKSKRYGRNVEVAKVFSQHEGYRALTVVEKKKDGMLMVSLPTTYGQIPLMILLRALGMENDEEIVDVISVDPKMKPYVLANIEECANEYGITCKDEAIAYLGKKFAGGQAKEYRVKRVEALMDRNLLPHLGNESTDRLTKAIFMARMGMAVLELALGKREPDDKDHYANKRLKLAGDLMEDLFRVAFTALCKDLKYQIERIHAKGKEIKISSSLRSDVLSQRIHHALATGNWVGGRAGISQLLDRTSNLAVLSHLRRVTSPLTRSQPHFEARDLHSTQWGRLCPNETPEGPNCGLVKNLALTVEISEGFPEKEVENILKDLGIKEITKKSTGTRVYLNGDLIGMHPDGKDLVQKLRERRRKGLLNSEVNVAYYDDANDVIVSCDCGRLRRPLVIVEKGKLLLTDKYLEDLESGKKKWIDLINEGIVEYIDAEEEENTLIALKEENITPDHTHMEMDPMCILGIGSSLVPYPEHNSSPRITMGAGMGKQSLGFGAANYRIRPDTRGHLMHYPEMQLVQTHPVKYMNFTQRPAGQNFCYEQGRR